MARINSRKKGARGDKLAIKFLTDWTGMGFVRTPASGGLRWKNTTHSVGDLICDEPNYIFPLSIEVKFYEDINFEHLLYHHGTRERKISRIKEFWSQCLRDAKRGRKIPFLMMRYNNLPKDIFFVVMSLSTWNCLRIEAEPILVYDKKIIITTTRVLSTIDWNEFAGVMMARLKQLYG